MAKPDPQLAITDRLFLPTQRGYMLALKPIDIVLSVDRLRREKQELVGELTVRVNGNLPQAQAIDGILSQGDCNLSSTRARNERAKLLAGRAHSDLDWFGFVEELCIKVLDAERKGKPATRLIEEDDSEESADVWTIDGFPLLRDLPMVLYGLGGTGKSYFSMWLAGSLSLAGVAVLYADWEFSSRDHRRRVGRLFKPIPDNLFYVRCERPLIYESDRLARIIGEQKIQYVVCDSMVFALNGPADDEQAGQYFRALRQLGVGTLNIAHTSKAVDDEKSVYGSVFFTNGARSVWFIEKATTGEDGALSFGLFHTKCNVGSLRKPKGYRLSFGTGTTTVEQIEVEDSAELADKLPPLDRIKRVLRLGPLTFPEICEKAGMQRRFVAEMMRKHQPLFCKLEISGRTPRYGLAKPTDTDEYRV